MLMELLYNADTNEQDFTLTDAILILAIDQEKPIFSFLSFSVFSAAFTSVLIELDAAGIVEFNGIRKNLLDKSPELRVQSGLPPAYISCKAVYDAITESKQQTIEDVASAFLTDITGSRLNQFAAERKARLISLGVLEQSTTKGWLGRESTKETVKAEYVDRIIEELRAELLEPGCPSDEAIILTRLLEKSGLLKHYFSAHEETQLKQRVDQSIQALEGQPAGKILGETDDLILYIFSLIFTTFMA